jgi:hypothetical protein
VPVIRTELTQGGGQSQMISPSCHFTSDCLFSFSGIVYRGCALDVQGSAHPTFRPRTVKPGIVLLTQITQASHIGRGGDFLLQQLAVNRVAIATNYSYLVEPRRLGNEPANIRSWRARSSLL